MIGAAPNEIRAIAQQLLALAEEQRQLSATVRQALGRTDALLSGSAGSMLNQLATHAEEDASRTAASSQSLSEVARMLKSAADALEDVDQQLSRGLG